MNEAELCGAAFKVLTPCLSAYISHFSCSDFGQASHSCDHFSFYLGTSSQNMYNIGFFALNLSEFNIPS